MTRFVLQFPVEDGDEEAQYLGAFEVKDRVLRCTPYIDFALKFNSIGQVTKFIDDLELWTDGLTPIRLPDNQDYFLDNHGGLCSTWGHA